MSITEQCHILQLSRSGVYYMPAPVSDKDAELMRLIDEIHLEQPYLGSRGMKSALRMRSQKVGRIHVRTLMRKMGIEKNLVSPNPIRITRSIPTYCADSISRSQRRLVLGHNVNPHGKMILLPRCHYGLGKQKSIVLEIIKHIRRLILYRGSGVSNNTLWNTGHIQYRPGEPIHISRFYKYPYQT